MTRDEMELQSWRYVYVVRTIQLSSGNIGVLDSRFTILGIVESYSRAIELTAVHMLAQALKKPAPRRLPKLKLEGLTL